MSRLTIQSETSPNHRKTGTCSYPASFWAQLPYREESVGRLVVLAVHHGRRSIIRKVSPSQRGDHMAGS